MTKNSGIGMADKSSAHEPAAAHGTYGQPDFSEGAQKTRTQTEHDPDGPHLTDGRFIPAKPAPPTEGEPG